MTPRIKILLITLLSIIVLSIFAFLFFKDQSKTISETQFNTFLHNGATSFSSDNSYIYFQYQNQPYKILKSDSVSKKIKNAPIEKRGNYFWLFFVVLILGAIALLLLWLYPLLRSHSKSIPETTPNKQPTPPSSISSITPDPSITLQSLAGISQVKQDLQEIIDYIKNPSRYKNLGLRLPKGILLVGPPGVGKTMLAKALANEAGIPFFYQSGSSFAQIYVGSGAKRVEELFAQAKKQKSAMIFIDEIDSVGKARGNGRNDEREATLNQLLVEIDGFEERSNLIVIGATNNASILDPALLRSGRFDRKIYIDFPTPQERIAIFALYLKNKPYDFDVEKIAQECSGFSGAMIENLINEAGLIALRNQHPSITQEAINQAKHKILFALKQIPILNQEQKSQLSLYQASKAFFALLHQIKFEKISLYEEDKTFKIPTLLDEAQIKNHLKLLLVGYYALWSFKNTKITYAQEDLNDAKTLAKQIYQDYGMGENLLDSDIQSLLHSTQDELEIFLQQHKNQILNIAQTLHQKEVLSYEEISKLL
ncbi:hypothetical protein BBW65_00565 [Helicobacter enhydrae]|uniref:AAA+ ATPase domain-containing protein n=1 Tax=Helicobacter enhydrae TaxID=222136 RepID=A0A1B1U7Q1_9HELI|nr:hypothetical protein BBW65_00565 [Helicobacter enhydrae]